jgi:hypothetical protein
VLGLEIGYSMFVGMPGTSECQQICSFLPTLRGAQRRRGYQCGTCEVRAGGLKPPTEPSPLIKRALPRFLEPTGQTCSIPMVRTSTASESILDTPAFLLLSFLLPF